VQAENAFEIQYKKLLLVPSQRVRRNRVKVSFQNTFQTQLIQFAIATTKETNKSVAADAFS